MNLKERINEDLKSAMKSGDRLRLETIRSIRALILEFEKSGVGREMNGEEEIKTLTGAAKKEKNRSNNSAMPGGKNWRLKKKPNLK